MAWPTDTCTTTYLDAGTDDPSLARAEIKTAVDAIKAVIAGRGTTSGVCDLDSSGLVPSSRLTASLITTALGYTPWHVGNDGAASGLDADLLDGNHAAAFATLAGFTMSGGSIAMSNLPISGIKTATFNGEVDNGNSGTADTITLSAGQKQKSTLTGNATLTIDPASSGTGHYQLRLIQDATGSRAVTWSGISSTQWLGSTSAPSINTAANGQTIITIFVAASTIICASASKVGAA